MANILFIEDERWGVLPYFPALKALNFNCTLVNDGDQAIEILEKEKFDLICIDVSFPTGENYLAHVNPNESGLTLLKCIRKGEIKNCPPDIKVIILTAILDPKIEKQIRHLKVEEYLTKPIDFNEFIEIISNTLTESK